MFLLSHTVHFLDSLRKCVYCRNFVVQLLMYILILCGASKSSRIADCFIDTLVYLLRFCCELHLNVQESNRYTLLYPCGFAICTHPLNSTCNVMVANDLELHNTLKLRMIQPVHLMALLYIDPS